MTEERTESIKRILCVVLLSVIIFFSFVSLASSANSASKNTVIATLTHRSASVNGIVLHYVMAGKGDLVVLLHGWPETWYMWRKVMPVLAKNFTVIAPDLRGFGNSSRPLTGYGGKIAAEDIYQLVKQLGYKQIFLAGHDIGAQVAYSYSAAHPEDVKKLVIMDYIFPGFYPKGFETGLWWFSFHGVPDLPEYLIEGKEREYLTWFYKGLAYDPSAINENDIDEYVACYGALGGIRAGFEYYRAFTADAIENQKYAKTKLKMPVLVLGGEFYPMFGGRISNPAMPLSHPAMQSTQMVAENVRASVVPNSGHWSAEENPEEVVRELVSFFGERK